LVTDACPAPPLPEAGGGVVLVGALVELPGALVEPELELLLLLPHPVATITVATTAANPSHPLLACEVTFLLLCK
jgi:hypothetical protein